MSTTTDKRGNDLITVCDKCLCASCWQGLFYCAEYQTAGTKQMSRAQLRLVNKFEHPSHWKTDEELAVETPRRFKTI